MINIENIQADLKASGVQFDKATLNDNEVDWIMELLEVSEITVDIAFGFGFFKEMNLWHRPLLDEDDSSSLHIPQSISLFFYFFFFYFY